MRFLLPFLLTVSASTLTQAAPEIDTARAQSNYMLNCQGCHLADGSGLPGSVPSMRGIVGSFLTVPGGRDFLVQVPGSANAPISDAELAELLNWILTTMSAEQLSPDFQYYTGEEVARLRQHTLVDVASVRAGIVDKIQ
jgi:mono/diheme cytochrome c family protein